MRHTIEPVKQYWDLDEDEYREPVFAVGIYVSDDPLRVRYEQVQYLRGPGYARMQGIFKDSNGCHYTIDGNVAIKPIIRIPEHEAKHYR